MNAIPLRVIDPFKAIEQDTADIAWAALRAECEAEFEDWQRADYDRREFEDFSNWLVNKARWNAPNKYGDALNVHERRLLNFFHVAAGHKAFEQAFGKGRR